LRIDGYRFGQVTIDGRKYTSDVIVFSDKIVSWWRQAGHVVAVADIKEIAAARPEVLIIGTGAYGAVRVLPEVENLLSSEGIKLIALPTREACEKYNRLRDKHRVVAALHLTC